MVLLGHVAPSVLIVSDTIGASWAHCQWAYASSIKRLHPLTGGGHRGAHTHSGSPLWAAPSGVLRILEVKDTLLGAGETEYARRQLVKKRRGEGAKAVPVARTRPDASELHKLRGVLALHRVELIEGAGHRLVYACHLAKGGGGGEGHMYGCGTTELWQTRGIAGLQADIVTHEKALTARDCGVPLSGLIAERLARVPLAVPSGGSRVLGELRTVVGQEVCKGLHATRLLDS